MKRNFFTTLALVLAFMAGVAVAQAPWNNLENVHVQVISVVRELQHLRQVNGYDLSGHAARAEQLTRDAESELHLAVDALKQGK